jgi:hypothetical protein
MQSKNEKGNVKYERSLQMINPNAAGLDLHKEKIWVCISTPSESKSSVRTFGTCTEELRLLVKFLKNSGVKTAAMESTGVYWIPVYNMFADNGWTLARLIRSPGKCFRVEKPLRLPGKNSE